MGDPIGIPLVQADNRLGLAAVELMDVLDLLLPRTWTSVAIMLQGVRPATGLHRLELIGRVGPEPLPDVGLDKQHWTLLAGLAVNALRVGLVEHGHHWNGMNFIVDRQLRTAGFAANSAATQDVLGQGRDEWARLMLYATPDDPQLIIDVPGELVRRHLVSEAMLRACVGAARALAPDQERVDRVLAGLSTWAQMPGRACVSIRIQDRDLTLPAQWIGRYDGAESLFTWAWSNKSLPLVDHGQLMPFQNSARSAPGMGALGRAIFPCDAAFAVLVARLVTYHAGGRALFIARLNERSFDVFALMNLGPLGL